MLFAVVHADDRGPLKQCREVSFVQEHYDSFGIGVSNWSSAKTVSHPEASMTLIETVPRQIEPQEAKVMTTISIEKPTSTASPDGDVLAEDGTLRKKQREKLKKFNVPKYGTLANFWKNKLSRNGVEPKFNQKKKIDVEISSAPSETPVIASTKDDAARGKRYTVNILLDNLMNITTVVENVRARRKRSVEREEPRGKDGRNGREYRSRGRRTKRAPITVSPDGIDPLSTLAPSFQKRYGGSRLPKRSSPTVEERRSSELANESVEEEESEEGRDEYDFSEPRKEKRKLEKIVVTQRTPSDGSSEYKDNESSKEEVSHPRSAPSKSKYFGSTKPGKNFSPIYTYLPTRTTQVDESDSSKPEVEKEEKPTPYVDPEDDKRIAKGTEAPRPVDGYPPDIPAYDPDIIPYVEVPDYSDEREESLDKNDRVDPAELRDYRDEAATEPKVEGKYRGSDTRVYQDGRNVDDDDRKEATSEENGARRPEGTKEDPESGERKQGERSERQDVHATQEPVVEFEPIHFDINEYKKPFDFEEFFKESRLFKSKVGKDAKAHESEKKIQAREESESSRKTKPKYLGSSTLETHHSTSVPEYFEKEYAHVSDNASSLEEASSEDRSEKDKDGKELTVISEREFRYGDRDFFKPFFEDDGKVEQRRESKIIEQEEDTFARLGDEITRKLKETSGTGKNDSEGKMDDTVSVETLSTMLGKRNYTGKRNVDPKIGSRKVEETVPLKYNNFWAFEYSYPGKKKQDT